MESKCKNCGAKLGEGVQFCPECGYSNRFGKLVESPFFIFAKPYFEFIGKGKIFSLVYYLMAAANLILPFVILYLVIDSGLFSLGAKYVFAFIFSWLVIVFACWIGFQLWWDRLKKVRDIGTSEFIAIPMLSEIIQTFGEWLGTLIGIVGAGVGLIAVIFLGKDMNQLFNYIGLDFMKYGIANVIIGPVIGCAIIIVYRFFAELIRLFAALVNNTKEIAANIKNNSKGV